MELIKMDKTNLRNTVLWVFNHSQYLECYFQYFFIYHLQNIIFISRKTICIYTPEQKKIKIKTYTSVAKHVKKSICGKSLYAMNRQSSTEFFGIVYSISNTTLENMLLLVLHTLSFFASFVLLLD